MAGGQAGTGDGLRPQTDLDTTIAEVIAARAIAPRFQPIVDLSTGGPVAFESLTRPTDGSFPNAAALFAAADRCGRRWCLEYAARTVALGEVPALPSDAAIFINCSPDVLVDPRFPDSVLRGVLATAGLSPQRVVLEITEQAGADQTALADAARALRARGFQIAVDDLGAGESGLDRVLRLRPDWIKLDRVFTAGIEKDVVRRALLRAIVGFSAETGIRLIVEGIETENELAAILNAGANLAQGYYIARPVEARVAWASQSRQHTRSLVAAAIARPDENHEPRAHVA